MTSIKSIFTLFIFCLLDLSLFAQYGDQLANRGFEDWTTREEASVSEPVHWHSGGTATGTWSGLVSSQIEQSSHPRPGSTGSKSVRLFPDRVLGITANGNITNGRMNAGSTSASGSGNYNYTQRSESAYNSPISQLPDSISIWVCFRSQSATDQAYVKAVVHGNTDYKLIANGTEEPADMHVATAFSLFTRTSTAGGAYTWRRLSIPFQNNGPCTDVRYLLLSATTNQTPGSGSTDDDLFLDDVLLIYNPTLRMEQLASHEFTHDDVVTIPFSLTGTMSPDNFNASANEVIAQLSDANGSFSNPTELGRVTTNTSGSITAHIPDVEYGQYKIRVVSTNYPMIGENIQDINIIDTSEIEENMDSCTVYPNPFRSVLCIATGKAAQSVRVYDICGCLLKEQPVSGTSFDLDMSELSVGVYLLQVDYGNSRSVHRILKAE
ncbi:MAG: T9SS type A sorting domain-containing protein [Bacteroidales bacterium]|nr:T9SS type A sorting domain-containing protein [Bacteroidales bacterium]